MTDVGAGVRIESLSAGQEKISWPQAACNG